ncbi:MAG TPA: dioxygenase [Bacteroidales bacterium]|nr:dioxygenase [Bacteroidales bacterium]
MSRRYYVILPKVPGSVEDEWKQCLDKILDIRNSGLIPVKINVFADLPDFETLKSVRSSIIDYSAAVFQPWCPALNVTIQPPEKPWKTVVEAAFILSGTADVTSREFCSIPYLILESEKGKELWAGGVSSYMYPDDTRTAAEKAFNIILAMLERENMSANDIVRQWNYIGNILQVRDNLQNYQIFNEVRSEYYHNYRTLRRFPAATGVGMKHGGVIMDFCAIQPEKSLTLIPVDNPNQVNAYEYGQQVLKGSADKGNPVKNPPQFERGLLLANQSHYTLFISGTASITGQETVGVGDIEKQTIVTIENIRTLSDPGRISELVSRPRLQGENFCLLRTYIKRRSDFVPVRQICERIFPGIPVSYVEADICRDDLLVEIEGEAEMN